MKLFWERHLKKKHFLFHQDIFYGKEEIYRVHEGPRKNINHIPKFS